jgi:signal transduction histidine kinase/PAS domain-containing protein/ActR/RegA family two-component response regulator
MALSRLMRAMALDDPTDAGRDRVRRQVNLGTLGIGLVLVFGVALVQPEMWPRVGPVLALLVLVCVASEVIAKVGHPRVASWVFVLGLLSIITGIATVSGGVMSPGVRSMLVIVLIAGVLLGERSAIGMGVLCASIAFTFAWLGETGRLPENTRLYSATAQAFLLTMYLGVTLLLMRLFARSVQFSFEQEVAAKSAHQRASDALQAVLRASGVGVWYYDSERDEYRGDERVHQLMGSDAPAETRVPGAKWRAAVHPDDLPLVTDAIARASGSGESVHHELRITDAHGTPRFLEVTFSPSHSSERRRGSVTGLVLDRTAERAARLAQADALATARERVKELSLLHTTARALRHVKAVDETLLRGILDTIPPAFLHPERTVARIECGALDVRSPGWREASWSIVTPIKAEHARGAMTVAYVGEADTDPFLREERELMASLVEMFESFLRREHAERERATLEGQLRQSQKMEALGTLAGGIAHDFNNILSAIGGNVSLARAEARPDDAVAVPLDEIQRAFERARDLVRRILLFSRSQESERKPMRVSPLLEEVAMLLKASAPPQVGIEARAGPDVPSILADASQLHQALVNLGTNGIFAMRERPGTLTLSVDAATYGEGELGPNATLPPGRYVRVSVRDEGAGIDAAIIDRLFEPFFTTKGSAGTGLGLAVVHGVMQSHGGAVTVTSQVGKGTTFVLHFPALAGVEAEALPAVQTVVRGQGERILYVDDEETIVFVMTRMLRSIGYACEGFTDSAAALHAFRTTPHAFDAVVTDYSMPGLGGEELAREVSRIRPGICVAISSGYGADQIRVGAASGVTAVIPKPVTIVELSHHLAAMLGRAPARPT